MHVGKELVAASATPLVLAILSEGESYGYAVLKRVSELSGGQLQWTDGMLYPVLHPLDHVGQSTAFSMNGLAVGFDFVRVSDDTVCQVLAQGRDAGDRCSQLV